MRTKKFTAVLLTLLMMMSLVVPSISALEVKEHPENLTVGDVNCDGKINVKDATEVQKHVAGITTLTIHTELCADANGDQKVNIRDATEIQKFVAGMKVSEYIGTPVYIDTEPETAEINFSLAEDQRIGCYGQNSSDTEIHIVRSTDEYRSVLERIDDRKVDVYYRPKQNPKYNSEYFEDNALVIVLSFIGSGNNSQTIKSLKVESHILTVNRTVYHAEVSSPDTQNRFALLEVSAEDVEGVSSTLDCVNDKFDGYIDFTVADDERLWSYSSTDDKVYVIKNVEEFDEILSRIYGNKPDLYKMYDDEYFENKALVISVTFVGGGCCSQWIGSLKVTGDTLTVRRTRSTSECCYPDMQYRWALMEVNAEDVSDVLHTDCETHIISHTPLY